MAARCPSEQPETDVQRVSDKHLEKQRQHELRAGQIRDEVGNRGSWARGSHGSFVQMLCRPSM